MNLVLKVKVLFGFLITISALSLLVLNSRFLDIVKQFEYSQLELNFTKLGANVFRYFGDEPNTIAREHAKGIHKVNKTIVWFDMYHSGHGLRARANDVSFQRCKVKTCEFLPHFTVPDQYDGVRYGPLDADAVIFQACHMNAFLPPIRRDYNQVFVFAEREAWNSDTAYESMNNRYNSSLYYFRDIFNWTMTYRMDSDIPLPYGEIKRKTRKDPILQISNNAYQKIFYNKKQTAAWLVSDCETESKRAEYIQELSQFMDVHIYGKCGTYECLKKNKISAYADNCVSDIINKYKFILNPENTYHTDYVTEKLFGWFEQPIIQVVWGGANYSKITPPDTVINADDFDSPKDLANFLTKVESQRAKYINYLKRKNPYKALGHPEMQEKAYCELCKKLHNLERNRRTYEHVGKWWQVNGTELVNKYVLEHFINEQ